MAEYIEREKVLGTIDELQRICATEVPEDKAEIYNDVFEEVYGEITRISAADVRPERHGHWIDNTMWYGHLGVISKKCSECGFEVKGDPTSRKNGMGGKYCENCGAKMDGKDTDK